MKSQVFLRSKYRVITLSQLYTSYMNELTQYVRIAIKRKLSQNTLEN